MWNIPAGIVICLMGLAVCDGLIPDKITRMLEKDPFRRCLISHGVSAKYFRRDLNSKRYNHLNKQWNLRKDAVYPVGYFLPKNAQDVSALVKCGVAANIHIVPSSGGHSYESIGRGTNKTIVVDFREMATISITGNGQKAEGIFEPGANVAHINAYLWENGGYALPMGNCLTVGIGGHAIGGGVGLFSALYGLTVDRVTEVEVVDARGKIVVANSKKNKELFWALRGSGPGYLGIVTRLKARLFQASENQFTLVRIFYPPTYFVDAYMKVQKFQQWAKENEPTARVTFILAGEKHSGMLPPLPPGMIISLTHIQDPHHQPNGNEAFLKAVRDIFPPPAMFITDATPNYIQFTVMTTYAPVLLPHPKHGGLVEVGNYDNFHDKEGPAAVPKDERKILAFLKRMKKDDAAPRYFKAKSFFIKKYFGREQLEKLAPLIAKMPNGIWVLCNTESEAIWKVGKRDTAYVHRDSLFDLTIQYETSSTNAGQTEVGMRYLYELFDAMKFMDGGETYQNYPDLDVKDNLERNFGVNLPRLLSEKEKWDPKNYFTTPISLHRKQEL